MLLKMIPCKIRNKLKNYTNQLLENLKKYKVHLSFIDNISCADIADVQLLSKFDKGIRFLLCVIDVYSKYASVLLLKDEKGTKITDAFQKLLDE